MAPGEEPRDESAPVMARNMRLGPAECLDDQSDVFDEMIDRIVFHTLGCVTEPVAPKVRGHGEPARFRERVHLFRPGLGALGEPVQQDDHLSMRRTVDHGSETEAVGLDHVLRGGHLQLVRMNSAATTSAWSSTLSRPCPWPLKLSSLEFGTSFVYCFRRSRRANGSRSPLRKRVGQRIDGR